MLRNVSNAIFPHDITKPLEENNIVYQKIFQITSIYLQLILKRLQSTFFLDIRRSVSIFKNFDIFSMFDHRPTQFCPNLSHMQNSLYQTVEVYNSPYLYTTPWLWCYIRLNLSDADLDLFELSSFESWLITFFALSWLWWLNLPTICQTHILTLQVA